MPYEKFSFNDSTPKTFQNGLLPLSLQSIYLVRTFPIANRNERMNEGKKNMQQIKSRKGIAGQSSMFASHDNEL